MYLPCKIRAKKKKNKIYNNKINLNAIVVTVVTVVAVVAAAIDIIGTCTDECNT